MKISTSYFFYLIDFTVLCGKASACLRSNCAEAINAYDAMYIQSGTCKRKIFSSVVKNSIVSIKHYLCFESHKAVNMKKYLLVFHLNLKLPIKSLYFTRQLYGIRIFLVFLRFVVCARRPRDASAPRGRGDSNHLKVRIQCKTHICDCRLRSTIRSSHIDFFHFVYCARFGNSFCFYRTNQRLYMVIRVRFSILRFSIKCFPILLVQFPVMPDGGII